MHAHIHLVLLPISQGEQNGEEGYFFQGDIRLMPYDDPYDLYNQIHKRMAFDREGSGISNVEYISPRLWPDGRIPYRYASELRKFSFGCCLSGTDFVDRGKEGEGRREIRSVGGREGKREGGRK